MPLKDDLLRKGYLPENLPPTFDTEALGVSLAVHNDWLPGQTRAAPYNASKRGMTRRVFSFVHPTTAHNSAKFIAERDAELSGFFGSSEFSLSVPLHTPDGDRAVAISSHSELEAQRLTRLSHHRFIARTDISRFYHSIYTHSVPWALHGKRASKSDRSVNSVNIFANRLDQILRNGQDGQTVGIPVGPDTSRYVAELIGTAIDREFVSRGGAERCSVIRHVDDVWIGADSHADVEEGLWRYRESIRAFELDINEAKTEIYSENFRFSDAWPNEIAEKFDFAEDAGRRTPERLRSAFEHAFWLTSQNRDDGVLKYTLRSLDRSNFAREQWAVVEPFLKRAAVHYGHTIDFVARLIVWRHLRFDDLSIPTWSPLLISILDRHGRLGNDAEVLWSLYAILRLQIQVPPDTVRSIIQNCGPLSLISALSLIGAGLTSSDLFDDATSMLSTEVATGPYWPVLLEWKSRQWHRHGELELADDLVAALAAENIVIFNSQTLPAVFQNVDEDDYDGVDHAIEERTSAYDEIGDDGTEGDGDDGELF